MTPDPSVPPAESLAEAARELLANHASVCPGFENRASAIRLSNELHAFDAARPVREAERALIAADVAIEEYYHEVSPDSAEESRKIRSERVAQLWSGRSAAFRRLCEAKRVK